MPAHAFVEEEDVDDRPVELKVQDLITWRNGHDKRCDERQGEMKKMIEGQSRLMLGMMVAVLAWSLVEVYRLSTTRSAAPAQPTIIYAPQAAPGAAPVVVNPVQTQPSP